MWTADKVAFHNNDAFIRAYQGSDLVWEKGMVTNYVSFSANEEQEVEFHNVSDAVLYYSFDRFNWRPFNNIPVFGIEGRETIYVIGKNPSGLHSSRFKFKYSGVSVTIGGNVMSLIDYENPPLEIPGEHWAVSQTDRHCFHILFYGNKSIVSVNEDFLPATELKGGCYTGMFSDCTNLRNAPSLPATILDNNCYDSMFAGCSSLTIAPSLPSTILYEYCYFEMFAGCSSLVEAPILSAATLVDNCYQHMFYGCSALTSVTCYATDISADACTSGWLRGVASEGTFYRANETSDWEMDSASGIPSGWTVIPPITN